MNGKYFPNPTFPAAGSFESPAPLQQTPIATSPDILKDEEIRSSVEERAVNYNDSILNLNKGKKISVYTSFPDSIEWKDKKFEGIIEGASREHLILSNPTNGEWYLIPMIYLDYISFEEKININSY